MVVRLPHRNAHFMWHDDTTFRGVARISHRITMAHESSSSKHFIKLVRLQWNSIPSVDVRIHWTLQGIPSHWNGTNIVNGLHESVILSFRRAAVSGTSKLSFRIEHTAG